jgi:hypothetical protein
LEAEPSGRDVGYMLTSSFQSSGFAAMNLPSPHALGSIEDDQLDAVRAHVRFRSANVVFSPTTIFAVPIHPTCA